MPKRVLRILKRPTRGEEVKNSDASSAVAIAMLLIALDGGKSLTKPKDFRKRMVGND